MVLLTYDSIIEERQRKLVVKKYQRWNLMKNILDLEIEIEEDEKELEYFRNAKERNGNNL